MRKFVLLIAVLSAHTECARDTIAQHLYNIALIQEEIRKAGMGDVPSPSRCAFGLLEGLGQLALSIRMMRGNARPFLIEFIALQLAVHVTEETGNDRSAYDKLLSEIESSKRRVEKADWAAMQPVVVPIKSRSNLIASLWRSVDEETRSDHSESVMEAVVVPSGPQVDSVLGLWQRFVMLNLFASDDLRSSLVPMWGVLNQMSLSGPISGSIPDWISEIDDISENLLILGKSFGNTRRRIGELLREM